MARLRRTKRAIWTDDIRRFGMETGFAACLHSMIQTGIDTGSDDPESVKAVAQFLQAARSATERKWRQRGVEFVSAWFGSPVIFTGYEWVTFKIPGGSYTPDYCYLLKTGHWVYVEIKGSKFQGSYRDARSRLRAAATLNPWADFLEIQPGKGGIWTMERIALDVDFLESFLSIPDQFLEKEGE